VVAGNYMQGTALGASNTVVINVNVTTAGQWAVATNTVAGMQFNNMGTLLGLGNQTITLVGAGTPNATGTHTFTVTVGTASCTFAVTVGNTQPPVTDHLILTQNSWWSYDDPFVAGDTVKRKNMGLVSFNGNNYREVEEYDDAGTAVYAIYLRKDLATNFYYEYAAVDDYSVITFTQQIDGDILILKEGLATNDTWNSSIWSGTDSTGATYKLRYVFTCTDANATVTYNGKTFNNVYKVTMKSQTAPGTSTTWTDEGLTWEYHYAQGVGLVWFKGTYNNFTFTWPIRNYAVF
jgi:hypothetical protein